MAVDGPVAQVGPGGADRRHAATQRGPAPDEVATPAGASRVAVRRVWLLAVPLAVVCAVTVLGFVADWDPDRIATHLRGPAGPVLLVVSMWLLQPFGVPGFVWMIPAGLIWPAPLACALVWVGNMGASSIAFAWARWAGRDLVAARIPPRVQRFDAALARGGLVPIILLRLLTGQLAPADWLLGVSSVRWPAFLVGTGIGIIPGIIAFVVGGSSLVAWLIDLGPAAWIAAGAALPSAVLLHRTVIRPSRRGAIP